MVKIIDGQAEYPDIPWSQGRMRMAKRDMRSIGGKEFRELEGLRKERQNQLSDTGRGDRYAQMNRNIMSDADIGTGAGAMSQDKTLATIEKLLKGQKLAQGQYDTQLKPEEEVEFAKWKKKFAPKDSGEDYDFRGAFKAGLTPDPDTGHWPDTFKKPNHPTFSDQSIYAKDAPDQAGTWEGETFKPPGGRG